MTRLLAVRPEERRGTVAAFLTIFGTLASHTLLETARDALFLARLPASRLAVVYLLIALVAVGLAQAPWGRRRATGAFALSRLLGAGSVVTFAFWALGRWQSPFELYTLYVWTGLLGSLAVLQFWMLLGDLYTMTQAKRLYSLVWTGSLLGATVGAGAARILAERVSATALVLAAAVGFALTALGPALALGRAEGRSTVRPRGSASLAEGIEILRNDAYVRSLAVLVLVSTVALTLGDYVFKSAVARAIPPAGLGAFFGGFYTILNLLALVAQLVVGSWLFRAIGLHRVLWILPALLFLGAAGVALGGGLFAALLLKGADGSLRNSVHRTGSELLYLPLTDTVRARAKPLIDIVGQRGGQALASLLILSESMLSRGDAVLAGASAAVSLVWIAWVADLKGLYLDVFRAALREGTLRPAVDLPPVDLVSLETLFGALNSSDDHEVVAAMDLLADEGRARLIPALILYHPSQRVVLRALELFALDGRADFLPVADRLMRHADAEIRAAALRARTRVRPDEALLRLAGEDPSPVVRATAVAGRVVAGWEGDEARRALEGLLADGETSLALARAIVAQPSPAFDDVLLRLADGPSDVTLVQVAQAMGATRSPRFLPALLHLLGRSEVRTEARAALVGYGPEGLAFLDEALGDAGLPVELRRHLPRAISLFEATRAAAVLERHVLEERSGAVRYRILRGMNRLAAFADAEFDPALLRRAAAASAEGVFRLIHWRSVLEATDRQPTPGHGLLVQMLRDKEAQAVERLFRILALQHRREDFKGIYRGLRAAEARARASSRELLENLLPPPLREPVLAIVDKAPDGSRLARAGELYLPSALDYEAVLGLILDRGGESLRCVAAHHVGELRLVALLPRLERLRGSDASFFLARVVERALAAFPRGGRVLPMPDRARLVSPLERMLYLKRVPMLSGLPGSDVAVIADAATERFFPAGTVVFREGVAVGAVYFVVQGSLATLKQGVRVGGLGPGSGVGGVALFARDPLGSQVVAEEDTLTLELEADAVSDVLDDHFPILHHVLREMSRRSVRLLTRFRLDPSVGVPECPVDGSENAEIDLVDRIFFLRRMAVFQRSSITALAEMGRAMAQVRFEPGTVLWREGEAAPNIFLVRSGRVQARGSGGVSFRPGPGFPLGALEALGEVPRWYEAVAETPVVALQGHVGVLVDVFEDNFGMAMDYLAAICQSTLRILDRTAERGEEDGPLVS